MLVSCYVCSAYVFIEATNVQIYRLLLSLLPDGSTTRSLTEST